MFNSLGGIAGYLVGVAMTLGLLLSPHLLPWKLGYRWAFTWPAWLIAVFFIAGIVLLAGTLWISGRLIKGAQSWKQVRVLAGAALIAVIANTLYGLLVEMFVLKNGARALIAVLGVPVIYGNLGAVLGRTSLGRSMRNILAGALTTMGGGFIIAALIRGW